MARTAADTDWLHHPSLTLPAYTYADAARLTRVPAQTIRNWFRGVHETDRTMEPVLAHSGFAGLSYLQLAEVAFVGAMRRRRGMAGGIKLSVIRAAYDYVRNTLGIEYPFVQVQFITEGTDLLIAAGGDPNVVQSASRPGQLAWREAVESYENQFDYDHDLFLVWHPRGRLRQVIVDPRISFGRPTIKGTGIPTEAVADRLLAGENPESVAHDFSLTPDQVEDARWFEQDIHPAA